MKIDELKVNSYGKLKNKDIKFEDGINIIYGENERGKSTLLNFIVNMFYGTSKIKKERLCPILISINLGILKNFQER